ncbi:unnamed protein product [Rotaria magnacalcarata]|uniref:Uncharacterized protein n=5 Tax=Rotaria magnacalcarata TaxID=392030 RepID=A0A816Y7Q4_9BILA|nr:unnamed protein product [Rotaria magnacalcarata]CAF1615984.1 unnamed protein product [Rotaria magnacalcarata]CAF1994287.1 unnamed protein product [Rotaria magnacalcarata]CAF2000159.1 unnamed protein product [Rotaria magnacalcarata]CAF2157151.1 unnamed protein product [Rotaria magnacalcarata]
MATTSVNNNDQITNDPNHLLLTDVKLFSVIGDEDGTDFDETTVVASTEKESTVKPSEMLVPPRQISSFSMATSSVTIKTSKSNSYRFVQLQRALATTSLLRKLDDQQKFENDYLSSLQENTFEEFLQNYYRKIYDHNERIKQKEQAKKERIFTFVDLEKNFFALDPTRDIKILFVDEPTRSSISRSTLSRSDVSSRHKSALPMKSNDAIVELFYANRSHRFLHDPSQAREEITLFARRAAERLHERLPRMSSVPHRVKVVDERDMSGNPDENALLQMKHKRALSSINKRRHLFIRMMAQSRKNQTKMEQQWTQSPIALDNAACCRELLERANQIEQVSTNQIKRRPQTAFVSRRTLSKNISPSNCSDLTAVSPDVAPVFSSCLKPFQDTLSIDHMEKTENVRVILPTRPLTAPTKVNWKNYC